MDLSTVDRTSILVLSILVMSIPCTCEEISVLEQLVALMAKSKYDFRLPPFENASIYIPVDVGFYVNAIGEIDEMSMDFSVNVYLRLIWTDHRLAWGDHIDYNDSISLPDAFWSDVWTPDPYLENGKDERTHTVSQENHSFRVFKTGKIFYSQRLTLKAWCFVDLLNFPLDSQECSIKLMSYRYTTQEVRLQWLAGTSIENFQNVKLARFTLRGVSNGDCTTGYSTGSYSCVLVQFHFDREFGYYFLQIYVPSGLIVLLSWVSFWLDPLAVPGRISLGVLTILTMSTQMATAATSALPKVSYIKAMDVWLTVCMIFLFAALVEFAVVNSLARREISKADKLMPAEDEPKLKVFVHKVLIMRLSQQQEKEEGRANLNNGDAASHAQKKEPEAGHHPTSVKVQTRCTNLLGQLTASRVDYMSRILFPSLFLIFNLSYWIVYKPNRSSMV